MNYYLVLAMSKAPVHAGAHWDFQHIDWSVVGVFQASSPEDACKAAARKEQSLGSFFAVEGYTWGVDLIETAATEFGVDTPKPPPAIPPGATASDVHG